MPESREISVRAVLFDFDGTLADSFRAITASTNFVRESYGLPTLSEEVVRQYVGFGLPNLMSTLLPDAPTEEAVQRYREHHPSVMISGTTLLPGVPESLAELHRRGWKLAVCSNKAVAFTKQLVEALGLAGLFDAILGPDDVGVPKPDPAMLWEAINRLGVSREESVYVGDMAIDVHTAKAAGIPVWLVPGGAAGLESPIAAGPDRVLDTFADLLALLPAVPSHREVAMHRENISTGSKYEPIIGFSRAVKAGPFVFVSGCTSSTPEGFVGKGDPYAQAMQAIKTIVATLEKAGAKPEHVVRTRMYLTNITDWEIVGKAHGEVFGTIRPASTIIGGCQFVSPDMLVEIEADAILPNG